MNLGLGKIIGIVGGLLVIIGTVLPWITIEGTDYSGISVLILFGAPVILLAIIGLVLAAIGKKGGAAIGTMVCGVIALLIMLLVVVVSEWIAELATYSGVVDFSVAYGTYIALVGTIILIVGGVLALMEAKKAVAPPAAPAPQPPMQPPAQPPASP